MTTLSDRLAAALVALEEAATNAGTADAILPLCTAARAWTRVADEVDGYVAPDSAPLNLLDAVTKGRAQAISDYEALRTRTDADIAALQDALATAERERDEATARAESAESGWQTARGDRDDWRSQAEAWATEAKAFRAATALTAPGPVVLPATTPSARPAVEAFDFPAIEWQSNSTFHPDGLWLAYNENGQWWAQYNGTVKDGKEAKATVERAHRLLVGQAVAKGDGDAIEAAAFDRGRAVGIEFAAGFATPEQRLRDAVIEAARKWSVLPVFNAPPWACTASHAIDRAVKALDAHLAAQAPAQVAQPAPVEAATLSAFYACCARSGEDPCTPEEALAKVRAVPPIVIVGGVGEWATRQTVGSGAGDSCPAPVEPAKGERFVVVRSEDVGGRPAEWKRDEKLARGYADAYNAGSGIFTPQPCDGRWHHCEYAVVDTAPAPSHLAGPLPGADQAEALIAAYVDAFAETSGTICDRWAEVDQKRKDHAIATMRRALLAVGATEPARVTVGEIVEAAGDAARRPYATIGTLVRGVLNEKVVGKVVTP